ncbi:MAG: polyprenyl synthetase family protein [Bdellovibrionales bacterium]
MIEEFESYCKDELSRFKKSSSKDFFESLKYSFFSGGKRARPQLLLSMGKEFGLKQKTLYPAAFAIELVHTYSLIHDDLPAMDDDTYRRGKLTHHAKYGEASAVLAGDGLLTFAFQILAERYTGDTLKRLVLMLSKSSGAFGMIGGQVLDCLTDNRDEEIFRKIHLLKTGMLFGFCIAAPGIIAEESPSRVDSLEELGHEIGLLFQLQDDLFDEDKKDERLEENILAVLSRDGLLSLIEEKKYKVLSLLSEFGVSTNSSFYGIIKFLFERKY